MRKLLRQKILRPFLILLLMLSAPVWSQIVPVTMTTTNSYTQDFDTPVLPNSGTTAFSVPAWFASATNIVANNGSSNTAQLYNYGINSNNDRALGSLVQNNGFNKAGYGLMLRNTSGKVINKISVQYTLEQWRQNGNADKQPLNFYYQKSGTTGSTAPTISTSEMTSTAAPWTSVAALQLESPLTTSASAAVNGNLAANRVISSVVSITGTTNLSLQPGEYIMLKWVDGNDSGNDHGLAIDDLTVSWEVPQDNDPAQIGGDASKSFTYGTGGDYDVVITGYPEPMWEAYTTGGTGLPAGITYTEATKKITVGPNVSAGSYPITIYALNDTDDYKDIILTVDKANQTITGLSNVSKTFGDPAFTLTGTGGASGQAVTYATSDTNITLNGNQVTIVNVGSGSATVTASQAGDANYNAAPDVPVIITIGKASQTISGFTSDISKNFGDAAFDITGVTATSGETVVFSSSDTNVATIVNNTVTIVGAGTATITASQAGNANYSAAVNVQRTLTVGKANQTITGLNDISKTYGDASFFLSATGGASGEAITYVSSDPTVASISANTVTVLKPGAVEITASQAGNDDYNAATDVVIDLTVNAKAITITGAAAQNKAYDGTTTAQMAPGAALTASEIVNLDDVALSSTYTADFSNSSVGTSKTVTATYTLTGNDASKYTLTQPFGLTADITAKELTISGIAVADKVYDGTTTATLTGTASLTGIAGTEDVQLDSSGAVAVFTSSAVGAAVPVVVSGYSLSGNDIANYTLTQPQGLTANITSPSLSNQTITFNALADTTYGASFTVNATASSGLNVTFGSSDTNIATVNGNTVTVVGVGPVDIIAYQTGNGSYNPAPSVSQALVINQKELTVTGAAVTDKIYDQGITAQVSGMLNGIINSDVVTLVAAGEFTSATAGNSIPVTPQYSITGNDAAKYTLTQPTLTGNILPATLTLDTPSASNKTYDGTTAATISGTLNGILTGDTVTLNGTGTFASDAVGNNIAITSTATLGGTHAANYTLTQPTGLTANITAVTGLTFDAVVDTKVYDRTNAATVTITNINGFTPGDDVTLTGTGVFNNAAVGNNKSVTVTYTLTGTDAGNYTTPATATLTGAITAKNLTVDTTATTVTTKSYDGTTNAALGTPTLIGVESGDTVLLSGGTFVQATPGTGIAVNSFTLSGTAAANYTLTQPTTLTGTITQKQLTIPGAVAQPKVYDGTTDATITGTLTGVVTGEDVSYTGAGSFALATAGGHAVTTSLTLSGADASNYTLQQPTWLTGTISKKNLTINFTADNKVYNRNLNATVGNVSIDASGIVGSDDVTVLATPVSATFANYNAGTGKTVTANFTLQGADAGNYSASSQTATADITPRPITADITNAAVTTRLYNGSTAATVSGVILTTPLTGDENLSTRATFDTANAGENKTVTLGLGGPPAPNYTLVPTTLTGTITKRTLTITAQDKNKQPGAANPSLTVQYSGFLSGENDTNASGYVAPQINSTATSSSPLGAYPITLTGGNSDNYEFTLVNGWMVVGEPSFTGRILAWDFFGDSTPVATSTAEIQHANLDSSKTLSRGSGASASAGSNSFRTQGFESNGISLSNTDYFQFSISASTNNKLSISTINGKFTGTSSFAASVSHQFAYSINGGAYTLIGNPTVTSSTTTTISVNVANIAALQNIPAATTVTFRYYASGSTNTGGWGFYSASATDYGLSISGTVGPDTALPAITSPLTKTNIIGETSTYQITATGTPTLTLSATALPTGATIDTNGLISFDGTTPAGIHNITLKADSYYGSDQKVLVYTVTKKDQDITLTPDPLTNKFANDPAFNITMTNTTGVAVTWASSDTAVATVDQNGQVTPVAAGTTTISVSNTGNGTYNAVNKTLALTVLPVPSLTATPAGMNFTAVQGQGASAASQVTAITGVDLYPAAGNITLTASTGFEVVVGVGSYASTGSFAYTGGVTNQTNPQIFVRLAAGAAQGTHTGTLTIAGGSATTTITLTATVDAAPEITTTAATYGPYCFGSANNVSVAFTTQGTFSTGNFYAQYSDENGVFPTDLSKTGSPVTASPAEVTLPATLIAGNYRVRVIHLSSSLVLTSSINNNGTDIVINNTAAPTAATLTFCGTATVANLTATGTALKWYAAATGGSALATTDAVTTGDYFVSQTLNNCESTRTQVAVTVNTTVAPTATALTFCGTATVANLTATGIDLKWYAAANGGSELATTDAVTTGNYFVSQTLNNCESTRTQVAVTVNTTTAPTATALTFCGTSTVANLTATGTALKWYAAATGGSALATTDAVTTGDYFVSQTLNGCESTRTQVAVTVNNTPAPTASALTFCGTATVANLTATGTALKWYAAATGGLELATTDAVTTGDYFVSQTLNNCESTRTQVAVTVNSTTAPTAAALTFCGTATVANLTATGTALKWYAAATGGSALATTDTVTTGNYFVSQTLNGCESARTQVAVTVNSTTAPTATALTFCGTATVANLTATGTALKWYAAATGGSALVTTDAVTTGNYFVSQTLNNCESARAQVAVTVNTTVAPTATALTFCGTTTVANLTATGTALKWYAAANGGSELATTDAVTTGNYFVSQTLNNCESTRTQVAVTVNTTIAPTATALTFCGTATVANLTATGTDLKWYAAATGGSALATTDAVTTGNYFVSQTLNNCESARTQVAVTVNTTTAPTATALTFCGTATVANLTATGTALKWYAAATGGSALATTDAVTTGNYFVSQTLNNCESTRTQVAVTVNSTTAPTATALTFCGTATVADLTATGTALKWYAAANGGSELATTDAVTTGNYFVSQTLNNCESARTQVTVTVNNTPAPTASALTFCGTATVADLTATGTALKWYAAANGGSELATTDAVTTGNYFVSQTLNGCESARTQVAVTLGSAAIPVAELAQTLCNGNTIADIAVDGTNLIWYHNAFGNQTYATTTVLTNGTYYVSQTIDGCESARIAITVSLSIVVAPGVVFNQTHCNGTLVSDLEANGANLKWYNSSNATVALDDNFVLITGTYYVSQTIDGCESQRAGLHIIINTTPAPTGNTVQSFTTETTINNLEAIGENIKWYLTEEDAIAGENSLSEDYSLTNGTTYYATQTINGCESNTTLAVTVNITLGNENIERFAYKFYPNPVTDKLYLEANETITQVTVYSLTGQVVINEKWNTQSDAVNMASIEAGTYIVTIKFGNKEKTIKVIRNK